MTKLFQKRCSKCGETDTSKFGKNASRKDGLQRDCLMCDNIRSKAYYKTHPQQKNKILARKKSYLREKRAYLLQYLKEHPCVDCEEKDYVVLEFDHLESSKKESTISELMGSGASLERLKTEVKKCVVRCANCHRRITVKRNRHWKLFYM